jgi:hypothetical protein
MERISQCTTLPETAMAILTIRKRNVTGINKKKSQSNNLGGKKNSANNVIKINK